MAELVVAENEAGGAGEIPAHDGIPGAFHAPLPVITRAEQDYGGRSQGHGQVRQPRVAPDEQARLCNQGCRFPDGQVSGQDPNPFNPCLPCNRPRLVTVLFTPDQAEG